MVICTSILPFNYTLDFPVYLGWYNHNIIIVLLYIYFLAIQELVQCDQAREQFFYKNYYRLEVEIWYQPCSMQTVYGI